MNYTIKCEFDELAKSVSAHTKIELSFTNEELHKFIKEDELKKVEEIQTFIHERAVEQFKQAKQFSQIETIKKQ